MPRFVARCTIVAALAAVLAVTGAAGAPTQEGVAVAFDAGATGFEVQAEDVIRAVWVEPCAGRPVALDVTGDRTTFAHDGDTTIAAVWVRTDATAGAAEVQGRDEGQRGGGRGGARGDEAGRDEDDEQDEGDAWDEDDERRDGKDEEGKERQGPKERDDWEDGDGAARAGPEGVRFASAACPGRTMAPGTPCVVMALALDGPKNQLAWNAVAGAEAYQIHRARADGGFELLATVAGTQYADEDVRKGDVVRYRVVAIVGGVAVDGCDEVELTTVPVLPSAFAGVAAGALGVAAYAVLRRR